MNSEANSPIGGGTNDRALDETLAETGPGVPTDAIGPGQMSVPDQIALADGPEAEDMAAKLQHDVDKFRDGT